MAYKRRKTTVRRRRMVRRKRSMVRRRFKTFVPRGMTSMFRYSRWQPTQIVSLNPSTGYAYIGLSFQLSDLNATDLTNYTNLFDSYRFNSVTIAMRLLTNPDAYANIGGTTGPAASNFYLDAYFVSDKTDASTPTSLEQLLQYGKTTKACLLRPNKWVYYHFYPKQQMLVYSGLASGYSTPMFRNNFIACDNGAVPHYGLKYSYGYPGGGASNAFYLEQKFRYNITFKGNK